MALQSLSPRCYIQIQFVTENSHADKQLQRINKHLYPHIGHIPITELKRQQIVDVIDM